MEIKYDCANRYLVCTGPKVSFSYCDLCLASSYLCDICFLQKLGKSREMRAVVLHNGRKGFEISRAKGTFLIKGVKM